MAKQLFCSLINTGTVVGWQGKQKLLFVEPTLWPRFVHTYSAEAMRLINVIADERPDIVALSQQYEKEKASTKSNPERHHKSRALNVTMQLHEDRVLSIMEAHAVSAGWQFDVLILRRRAPASARGEDRH